MTSFAQPSVLRKPLLAAERAAPARRILVTGATGYIGSRVVERLLACGHSVRVLCRPRLSQGPFDMLQYLQALPGADRHLTVVSGDVSDTAALQAAMAQCEQLVHLAAVVDIAPPRDEQHKQQMIQTALDGTSMVLDAATASNSIRKVILASSIVSVMWDWWERGTDYVYSEEDWTLDSSVALNCYAYCKRESERLAYQLAQGKRWELITINPGVVFGPVAAYKLAESASVWQPIVQHMNGDKYPFTSNLYVSHVDLDDVAAATCGLLATPGAAGRHLLMSGPARSMPQIASLLAEAYPTAKVPYLTAPGAAVALLAKFNTHKLGFDVHKFWAMHNKPYNVDASKITRVLPDFSYIPLEDSVRAAADSIVAMGLAAFHGPSWTSCSGLLGSIGAALGWSSSPAASAAAEAAAAAQRAVHALQGAADMQHEAPIRCCMDGVSDPGAVVTAVIVSPAPSQTKMARARAELELSIGGTDQLV